MIGRYFAHLLFLFEIANLQGSTGTGLGSLCSAKSLCGADWVHFVLPNLPVRRIGFVLPKPCEREQKNDLMVRSASAGERVSNHADGVGQPRVLPSAWFETGASRAPHHEVFPYCGQPMLDSTVPGLGSLCS